MGKSMEERQEEAKQEFRNLINSYLLPLFDVRGSLKCESRPTVNKELITIVENEKNQTDVYFYPRLGTEENPTPFYCKIGIYSSSALKKPATSILRELLKVTEYNYDKNFRIKRNYGIGNARQISYKSRTMDLAFELGMCQWIAPGPQETLVLHTIICRMLEWSGRTYEGKNVPFGIVIDFKKEASEGAADYLHFLTNDSSAVFTDGVFTGILLDRKGKVISFLTRGSTAAEYENVRLEDQLTLTEADAERDVFVPYQFEDIAKHCEGSRIGIIVLTNGEILIIKEKAICFAKRGRRWVCFDWSRIYSNLRPYFLAGGIDEVTIRTNVRAIYCTLLDVSFAHTGGCLALVLPQKEKEIDSVVKERIDLFITGNKAKGISAESREKIEVLTYLLSSPVNRLRPFFEIEKPVRKEILSLDGATVVSTNGTFYCAGSIVAVSGGSSGGGRTAAAKKLAQFGVGIKISEDGYVEAYGIDLSKEDKNAGIVPVFKFK